MEQVIEILKLIQNTSSLNEKQRILRENKGNELLKKCLVFLLDGNTVTGISTTKMGKMTISKAANYATFELKNFSEVIDYLKTHNTGTDVDVATIRKFICNNSKSEAECKFYEEMVTKKFKLGAGVKLANQIIPGLISTFEIQNGKPLKDCKIKKGEIFYISRKMNGLRGPYDGTGFKSRQNKELNGLGHIVKDIEALGYKDYFLDGELLYKNPEMLCDDDTFKKGTGIVNSNIEDKTDIKLVVFDILPIEEFHTHNTKTPYSVRFEQLNELERKIKEYGTDNIEVVPRVYHGTDQSKIQEWLEYAENNDWEGCMLNLDVPYQFCRTNKLIKVKQFHTCDIFCTGVKEGEGRDKGKVGSIVCSYKGYEVSAGSGLTEDLKVKFWNHPEEVIGKIVTIQYKTVSTNKNDDNLSLQFPKFVCVRYDKNEESYED